MLIRNYATDSINQLLRPEDLNVRITPFFFSRSRFQQASLLENSWIETLRAALGSGITNSENNFKVRIYIDNPLYFLCFCCRGDEIIAKILSIYDGTLTIRISITQEPFNISKERTWIIWAIEK